ncbi:MAG: hypothetical protein GY759_20915 [Chloroflexi bacterium]|nr:hypothetical protein [Chloroflexota bacterium]
MSERSVLDSNLGKFLANVDIPLVPDFAERKIDKRLLQLMATDDHFLKVFSFLERGGWYAADSFLDWMRKYMDRGQDQDRPRQYSKMSFAELHEATGRELTLIAADTSGARMLVLNRNTAPGCPVVWAARMSMSGPLLWQEVEWQAEWGKYRDSDIRGHTIVDGGMLSNFPIELFISDAPQVIAVMGEKQSEEVIGFLIDESLPVQSAPPESQDVNGFAVGNLETIKRLQKLINTATQAHDRAVIEAFEQLVVRVARSRLWDD